MHAFFIVPRIAPHAPLRGLFQFRVGAVMVSSATRFVHPAGSCPILIHAKSGPTSAGEAFEAAQNTWRLTAPYANKITMRVVRACNYFTIDWIPSTSDVPDIVPAVSTII